MNNQRIYLLLVLFLFPFAILFSQVTMRIHECAPEEIKDTRDLTENIPGETMGQKLESLLFWTQEEKERRFPIMQSIYPSLPVAAGTEVYPLLKAEEINPKWESDTDLASYIEDNRVGGVVVLKDGEIKLEAYNKGIDQNTLWTSYSVAKSISSMLVGVALKEGDIKSMDDLLEDYIPELKGYPYGKVTVRQLLTMTSGIAWSEDYEDPNSDVAQMYMLDCVGDEAHILTYMKSLEQVHTPGEHWNYSTGETDLVGILVQKATGKSLGTYLSEKIWQPFGMQQCGHWLADECSDLNIGGSGLSASLRDYARLGLLMLQDGEIDGESIFAEEWLADATSLLYQTNEQGGGYGYLWWRNPDGSYSANGIFGQMIYINPMENIIIAQMAAWPHAGSEELGKNQQDFINAVLKALN
ncbi:MAG TPA: serine hydrolase [Flavobacteriaceae bacterium]|nr:serine hydrolase [Flavobacteriaceae bacterium]